MASHHERVGALLKKVESLLSSATGLHEQLAVVTADVAVLDGYKNRCECLGQDLIDASESMPELIDECVTALSGLEEEVTCFARETSLARTFFRRQPARAEAVPSDAGSPNAYRLQKIAWRLGALDLDHPQPWVKIEGVDALFGVMHRMKALEPLTWAQIYEISRHNHPWEDWSEWEKPSRDRLQELQLDDQDGWYQIQIDRLGRLIGFRDGNVFNVLWWDRDHEVYKTKSGKKR